MHNENLIAEERRAKSLKQAQTETTERQEGSGKGKLSREEKERKDSLDWESELAEINDINSHLDW